MQNPQSETSNHQQNHDTAEDCDILWENCPKRRKWRKSPLVVSLLASVGIIVYASLQTTTIDYQPDNSSVLLGRAKICYTKNETKTYPTFFNLGLGLIGLIVGTVVDRFFMFLEELFQLKSRYDGKCGKALKASFSGIFWPAVIIVAIVILASLLLGKNTPFEVKDVIYVLGGIGVGPLVVYLLNLNKETDVHVSRILEEKEMSPGYTLAWSYYFNHLKPNLKKFHRDIVMHQNNPSSSEEENEKKKLSLNKLLLLLPPRTDLTDIDRLTSYDETITKHQTGENENPYPFPIYCFESQENKCFAMQCIREPIISLKEMRGRAKFFTNDTWKKEIKRFYPKMSKILANAPKDDCAKMSLIVPIKMEDGDRESLRHGSLSEIITRRVETSRREAARNPSSSQHPITSPNVQSDDGEDASLLTQDNVIDPGTSTSTSVDLTANSEHDHVPDDMQ